ncbi:ROK family protein [Actinospica durhamensis]|uniref:ROK family protein n=1 Tax=Actinospica durhamensis TaxID=1508375 RepID=A0A941EQA4_9ACTN|nr:ROK family protein [Actinospica durhamensis]MBR7835176.1 ROK family protein [Actinospica durhamensis]
MLIKRDSGESVSGSRQTGVESHMSHVLALDVGGTFMKGAVIGSDHVPVVRLRFPTPRAHGPEATTAAIASALVDLHQAARERGLTVKAAGVAVPGIVDETRRRVLFSANIGWRDTDLAADLTHRLAAGATDTGKLPVILGHDVASAGIAEARIGAAQGYDNALIVPIGTGIAAALISEGRPIRAGGYAGQLGHIVIEPNGEPCGCGNRGCLATIAAASAIARRYAARTGKPESEVNGAHEVLQRLHTGDTTAHHVWHEAIEALATALAQATNLLAPEVIVIGGGLAQAGEPLLAPLRESLAERLTFQRLPKVVPAQLGDEAGCLGIGLSALEHIS